MNGKDLKAEMIQKNKFSIDELNEKLQKRDEYRTYKIFKKSEYPEADKFILACSLGCTQARKSKDTLTEALSKILRIKVKNIYWADDNKNVVIEYLEN